MDAKTETKIIIAMDGFHRRNNYEGGRGERRKEEKNEEKKEGRKEGTRGGWNFKFSVGRSLSICFLFFRCLFVFLTQFHVTFAQ